MKLLTYCLSSLALTALAGCADDKSVSRTATPLQQESLDSDPDKEDRSEVTGQEVKRDIGEAGEATSQYLKGRQDEFRRDLERRMSELDRDIDQLKQRAGELREEARPRWEAAMKELEMRRERTRAKLEELSAEAPGAWEQFREGVEKGWDDLKEGYNQAAKEFEDGKTNEPKP